jgi:hypothetical protein
LESGATYLKRLTASELAEWEEGWFQSLLEETMGPTNSLNTQSIDDETTGPSITQPTSPNANPISDSSTPTASHELPQPDPVAPKGTLKRHQPNFEELLLAKRTLTNRFINLGVTGVDGTAIIVHKKL